ncbi:MAG: N-acetylmannosamine-6-phosphate 2-epimerase [Gloeocapsa sp. DLM2.Bin57]|nr:MAG: N-acetylmannosamine-6-phosphate 2-epimerase [Gloeocapsa sp. DLM2.Bin57]
MASLQSKLIVSCQAPSDSPLHQPEIIAAIAKTCIQRGAIGVRIDTPSHILAVKKLLPNVPVIGLWKRIYPNSPVYITPTLTEVKEIISAGADIIAIDATSRQRPQESLAELINYIHQQDKLAMADIDTVENAIASEELGVDLIATTLYGYTEATCGLTPPGFSLLSTLSQRLITPLICEGGINSPIMAKQALSLGAYSIVIGTAITGIDQKVTDFLSHSC